jgi:hypothetical protein
MLSSIKNGPPPRPSGWTFKTSNGGGLSAGLFGGEGGSVTLLEPKTGRPVVFYYAALGFGLSAGVKLPKLGKLQTPGIAGSSESFTSMGQVYMNGQFHKPELTVEDINGGCTFLELSVGAAWGTAGYAMVFGMNTAQFLTAMAGSSNFSPYAGRDTSTGMLVFGGLTFGLQAGGGITSFAGVLRAL